MKEKIETDGKAILGILRDYGADISHPCHVAANALRLFDLLQDIHRLGTAERNVLLNASLLHDIGWVVSGSGHHKHSMEMILSEKRLDFEERERLVVANIARYHRKSFPSEKHPEYAKLEPQERETVRKLAAILRLSDAMDYLHRSAIDVTGCTYDEKTVTIACSAGEVSLTEETRILDKSSLFQEVFGRSVRISWTKAMPIR